MIDEERLMKEGIKKNLLIAVFFAVCIMPGTLEAQDNAGVHDLQEAERKIAVLFERMRQATDDGEKLAYNDSVLALFLEILPRREAFLYSFDTLRYTGRLYPPDSTFRIINWNLSFSGDTYRYYGFIRTREGQVITLHDHSGAILHPGDTLLSPAMWYGALYYRILENKWRNKTYYTLLGIDLHDALTTRKVIDVLTFDRKGEIRFGAPIFDMGDSTLTRVIFRFNAQVSMLLHYDPQLEMIVFDHLSPSRPEYRGNYQFYGPDSSYDGFFFYRGMWRLRQDLDVRNRR